MNISKVSAFGLMLVFCLMTKIGVLAADNLATYHVPVPYTVSGSSLDNEADIELRVTSMSGLVSMKYTKEVKAYISSYLNSKKYTSILLGRQSTYFPIFEEVLNSYNLPMDLKYLPVVESSLKPAAVSRVGATGLWQIMKPTGRMLGLKINWEVDERKSPYRSTEAAVEYLSQLYDKFGSWELALAAYNCGPGNVRKAIRRGGSKDFWTIKKYLPKETRNYIPALIAVTYLSNYYYLHDLEPIVENGDFLTVSNLLLYEQISFDEIQEVTGVSKDIIKKMNPSFLRNYVPASETGHHLMLPSYATRILINHLYQTDLPMLDNLELAGDNTLVSLDAEEINEIKLSQRKWDDLAFLPLTDISFEAPTKKTIGALKLVERIRNEKYIIHRMRKRQSLKDVARMYDVSIEELIQWNALEDDFALRPGQMIKVKQ